MWRQRQGQQGGLQERQQGQRQRQEQRQEQRRRQRQRQRRRQRRQRLAITRQNKERRLHHDNDFKFMSAATFRYHAKFAFAN